MYSKAQKSKVLLLILLIASAHTDLGDENERASGYFDDEWQWEACRENTRFRLQFHSRDDPLIPIDEGRFVAQQLQSNFVETDHCSHFFDAQAIERAGVIDALVRQLTGGTPGA